MSTRPVTVAPSSEELVAVTEPLRRFVRSRVDDPDFAQDVLQETLVRLWEVRWRLEPSALLSYGVVVARNVIASHRRQLDMQQRHEHRLATAETTDPPDSTVLEREEYAALATALARLGEADRAMLVGHAVDETDLGDLASSHGISPGAAAARLARGRARLRVQFVLALRRQRLTNPRCQAVLEALSLGDLRRQHTLDAGRHLLDCERCASLSAPLLTRSRVLAAVLPFGLLVGCWRWIARTVQAHPAASAVAGGTGVAAVTTVAVVLANQSAPLSRVTPVTPAPAVGRTSDSTASAAPGTLRVGATQLLPAADVGSLRDHIGEPVVADGLSVQAVPADEGFWVGTAAAGRVWVQLETARESAVTVRRGDRVSFRGTLRAATPGTAERVGLTTTEGAAQLAREGAFVAVPVAGLRLAH